MEPRRCLKKISAYKLPGVSRTEKIKLDLNENTKGCSPRVIKALKNLGVDDVTFYPEYNSLIKNIATYHNVKPGNIILTNGGDDAIRCIIDTYIEKGDEIIIPVPTFAMFELWAKIREAKVKKILCNSNLSFPGQRILKAITKKTRMVVIANPNSPTGTSMKKQELIKILFKAKNAIVLLDETYHHFAKRSYVGLINRFKNLIIMDTFSKVFGLAGLRIGFIVSNSNNIDNLSKINLPYSVNSVAVIAANEALNDKRYIKDTVRRIEIEKIFLYTKLKKMGIKVYPSKTNFLLARLDNLSDVVHKRLLSRGILVKNMNGYPMLNGFLRITIGTRRENMTLLKALGQIL